MAVVIIAGLLLVISGHFDQTIDALGMGKVADANDTYLEESFDKSVTGFLILSAIKSGLAVIEGSEIGIGFNLELGDVVQSVYDYVDVAWKTALAGGTVILLTRLILQSVELIDHWCMAVTLIAGLMSLLVAWLFPALNRTSRMLKESTFFLSTFCIILYLVLPFSITGAAFMSAKITRPLIDESHQSFESIKADLSFDKLNRQLFAEESPERSGWFAEFDLKAKYKWTKAQMETLAAYLQEKTRNMAIWTIQLVAGYLFDSIVFPVTFFIILFVVTKSILVYLFEDRRQQAFTQDVVKLLNQIQDGGESKQIKKTNRLRSLRRMQRFMPHRAKKGRSK